MLASFCMLYSCADDTEKRAAENARDQKKKDAVFSNISNAWTFNTQPINPASQALTSGWPEWRILLDELSQKPKSTIGAFRKKAKTLSLKVKDMTGTVPAEYNKPQIKARIAVLQTKINSLNLYVNLGDVPDKKVIALIADINTELAALQRQIDEIVRKKQIPKEQGESDMIKMLDTSRAIPNVPKEKSVKFE